MNVSPEATTITRRLLSPGEMDPQRRQFECAIHALAPLCAHCGYRILGHGVESPERTSCCAHSPGTPATRASGRAFRSFIAEITWPELELVQLLKTVRRSSVSRWKLTDQSVTFYSFAEDTCSPAAHQRGPRS